MSALEWLYPFLLVRLGCIQLEASLRCLGNVSNLGACGSEKLVIGAQVDRGLCLKVHVPEVTVLPVGARSRRDVEFADPVRSLLASV